PARLRTQVLDGIRPLRENNGSLMTCWEEGGGPVLGTVTGIAAMIRQDYERRKIVGQAPEPVADPGTHAGKPRAIEAGRLQVGGLAVYAGSTNHVVDEGDVVDAIAQRGNHFTERLPAVPIGTEAEGGFHPRAETVLKRFDVLSEVRFLAVV